MCRQSREALGSFTYELAAAIYRSRRARNALKSRTLIYRIRICWRVKVSRGYRASIYHKPTSRIVHVPVINRHRGTRARATCLWRVFSFQQKEVSGLFHVSLRRQTDRLQFSCMVFLSRRICKGIENLREFMDFTLQINPFKAHVRLFCIISQLSCRSYSPFCYSRFFYKFVHVMTLKQKIT